MSLLTIASTQMPCSWDLQRNLDQAEQLVREAAAKGAQVILLQELFATPYFCIEQRHHHLALAQEYGASPILQRFAALAKELGVVLPLSWFEKAGNAYFNSLSVADADGRLLGVYRKTHIPNAIGYQEKEYFSPGDTGFRVWDTAFGRLGVGICWDQWFPETARCLALQGAEVLLFPTAIGVCGMAWGPAGITAVQLPEPTEEGTRQRLLRNLPAPVAEAEPPPAVQSATPSPTASTSPANSSPDTKGRSGFS